jgi:hypothetical protein
LKKIAHLLASVVLLLSISGLVLAYDNGYGDADMPTTIGGCSDARGCHIMNAAGSVVLTTVADDGTWDTPGEAGTITATVNIDAVADDDSIPGVALLDADWIANIKSVGWWVISDPNSNPSPFNYNERNHVSGDEVLTWHVTAPNTPGTYTILGRLFCGRDWYNQDTAVVSLTTGIAEGTRIRSQARPTQLRISPNPFAVSTRIIYQVSAPGDVSLRIHDLSGRSLGVIRETYLTPGVHSTTWDGTDRSGQKVPEGIYFLRLNSAGHIRTAKLVLLK